jgi:hypothetical protein
MEKEKKKESSVHYFILFFIILNFVSLIAHISSFMRSLTLLISCNIYCFCKAETFSLVSDLVLNNMKTK